MEIAKTIASVLAQGDASLEAYLVEFDPTEFEV